jgi:hypothetical protein
MHFDSLNSRHLVSALLSIICVSHARTTITTNHGDKRAISLPGGHPILPSSTLPKVLSLKSTKSVPSKAGKHPWKTKFEVFLDGGKGFHEFSLYGGNMEEQDVRSIQTVRQGTSLVPSLPVIPPLSAEEAFRASFINKTAQPVLLHKYLRRVPHGQSVARLDVPTGTISDIRRSHSHKSWPIYVAVPSLIL